MGYYHHHTLRNAVSSTFGGWRKKSGSTLFRRLSYLNLVFIVIIAASVNLVTCSGELNATVLLDPNENDDEQLQLDEAVDVSGEILHERLKQQHRSSRQLRVLASALRSMGCLPKFFCGMNSENGDSASTLNDLAYLIKFSMVDADMNDYKRGDPMADMSQYGNLKGQVETLTPQQNSHSRMNHELISHGAALDGSQSKTTTSSSFSSLVSGFKRIFRFGRSVSEESVMVTNQTSAEVDETTPRPSRKSSSRGARSFWKTHEFKKELKLAARIGQAAAEMGGLRGEDVCSTTFNRCPYTIYEMKDMVKVEDDDKKLSASQSASSPYLYEKWKRLRDGDMPPSVADKVTNSINKIIKPKGSTSYEIKKKKKQSPKPKMPTDSGHNVNRKEDSRRSKEKSRRKNQAPTKSSSEEERKKVQDESKSEEQESNESEENESPPPPRRKRPPPPPPTPPPVKILVTTSKPKPTPRNRGQLSSSEESSNSEEHFQSEFKKIREELEVSSEEEESKEEEKVQAPKIEEEPKNQKIINSKVLSKRGSLNAMLSIPILNGKKTKGRRNGGMEQFSTEKPYKPSTTSKQTTTPRPTTSRSTTTTPTTTIKATTTKVPTKMVSSFMHRTMNVDTGESETDAVSATKYAPAPSSKDKVAAFTKIVEKVFANLTTTTTTPKPTKKKSSNASSSPSGKSKLQKFSLQVQKYYELNKHNSSNSQGNVNLINANNSDPVLLTQTKSESSFLLPSLKYPYDDNKTNIPDHGVEDYDEKQNNLPPIKKGSGTFTTRKKPIANQTSSHLSSNNEIDITRMGIGFINGSVVDATKLNRNSQNRFYPSQKKRTRPSTFSIETPHAFAFPFSTEKVGSKEKMKDSLPHFVPNWRTTPPSVPSFPLSPHHSSSEEVLFRQTNNPAMKVMDMVMKNKVKTEQEFMKTSNGFKRKVNPEPVKELPTFPRYSPVKGAPTPTTKVSAELPSFVPLINKIKPGQRESGESFPGHKKDESSSHEGSSDPFRVDPFNILSSVERSKLAYGVPANLQFGHQAYNPMWNVWGDYYAQQSRFPPTAIYAGPPSPTLLTESVEKVIKGTSREGNPKWDTSSRTFTKRTGVLLDNSDEDAYHHGRPTTSTVSPISFPIDGFSLPDFQNLNRRFKRPVKKVPPNYSEEKKSSESGDHSRKKKQPFLKPSTTPPPLPTPLALKSDPPTESIDEDAPAPSRPLPFYSSRNGQHKLKPERRSTVRFSVKSSREVKGDVRAPNKEEDKWRGEEGGNYWQKLRNENKAKLRSTASTTATNQGSEPIPLKPKTRNVGINRTNENSTPPPSNLPSPTPSPARLVSTKISPNRKTTEIFSVEMGSSKTELLESEEKFGSKLSNGRASLAQKFPGGLESSHTKAGGDLDGLTSKLVNLRLLSDPQNRATRESIEDGESSSSKKRNAPSVASKLFLSTNPSRTRFTPTPAAPSKRKDTEGSSKLQNEASPYSSSQRLKSRVPLTTSSTASNANKVATTMSTEDSRRKLSSSSNAKISRRTKPMHSSSVDGESSTFTRTKYHEDERRTFDLTDVTRRTRNPSRTPQSRRNPPSYPSISSRGESPQLSQRRNANINNPWLFPPSSTMTTRMQYPMHANMNSQMNPYAFYKDFMFY